MAFKIDFKILRSSIVNTKEDVDVKKDLNEPFSFIQFVQQLDINNVTNDFVVDVFNQYLIEWSKIKKQPAETFKSQRKAKYVELLKTIQLNFVTQDEERILSDIDFDDPLEVEVAIPFFVEKIKDIIVYYQNKRRSVKTSKSKWSTKGSLEFLRNVVSEYIIDNYTKDKNTFQKYRQDYQELSSFQKKYDLTYFGLYDTKDYRTKEVITSDLDFSDDGSSTDLSSLPITSFYDYNRSKDTLTSELKKDLFKKYVSTDLTYYDASTSVDIDSTTPFHDTFNHSTPFISRISTTDGLLKQDDIGYYFTSRFIYAAKYISMNGISLKDTENFNGIIPKLNVYNNEDYVDYYLSFKYDVTYGSMANKPIKSKRAKRLYGYQSRELDLNDSSGGVERFTDNTQLWTGYKNEVWDNSDIYDKFSDNILNRDSKNSNLFNLSSGESVYKYGSDIFGNEYYLIKEIHSPNTSQSNVYPLDTRSGVSASASAEFILIGQRYSAINALSSVEIDDNLALGYFIGETEDIVDSLKNYHLATQEYYELSSIGFNSIELSNNIIPTYKSIYENNLSTGRIIIRTSNSEIINPLSSFLPNIYDNYPNLYGQLSDSIINFDIVRDFIVFETSDYIMTSEIEYDYDEAELKFKSTLKNISNRYNDPLCKTSTVWHDYDKDNIYFSTISSLDDKVIPTVYKLDNNRKLVEYSIEGYNLSSYSHEHDIEIESISKPNIIQNKESIYSVTMLKDICDNNIINVLEFDILDNKSLNLLNNDTYNPDYFLLNSEILSSDSLTSLHSTIKSNLSSDLVYYSDGSIVTSEIPYNNLETKKYFDNDTGSIETKDQPNLEYNLSDIVTSVSASSITQDEDSYTFETKKIYTPSSISLDITKITNFSSYVSPNDHIMKVEYELGSSIITKGISNSGDIFSLYDPTLTVSPLNQQPYVYENISTGNGPSSIFIRMYSTSGKLYLFEVSLNNYNIEPSLRFSKLELLDSRIIDSNEDKNLVLYLNTRTPDFVTSMTLINI